MHKLKYTLNMNKICFKEFSKQSKHDFHFKSADIVSRNSEFDNLETCGWSEVTNP